MPARPVIGTRPFSLIAERDGIGFEREQAQLQIVLTYLRNSQNIAPHYLLGPSRGSRHLSRARQTLYYLLHICFGMSFTRIAELVHRDRTSVSHGVRQIEDLRDQEAIDRYLHFAELAMHRLFYAVADAKGDDDDTGR